MARPTESPPLLVSTGWLAAAFKVTEKTIAAWHGQGMPGRRAHGRYDLGEVVRWRRARDKVAAATREGPLAEERRRLIAEQTIGHEIANEARAAALLPREDVLRDVEAVSAIVQADLERLADRAADALVPMPAEPADVRRALAAACRRARAHIAAGFEAHGRALADDAPTAKRPKGNGATG
jgi:phage terminase Nu1 subunit (DNA packaging protein)